MRDDDRSLRLYRRADRVMTRALRLMRGTFDGVWLGVLSRGQLSRLDELYYRDEPRYYDEAYNRCGLFDWEQAAVDTYFTGVRRIVVTSAGAGRELLALAAAGYQVHGFEPHVGLQRFGSSLVVADGLDASLAVCDRDLYPGDAPDADAVVVGWGGYMHISDRSARVRLLTSAAARLAAGSPLLISFFAVDRANLQLRTAARVGTAVRRVRGREPVRVGDALVPTFVHYFTRDQVEAEMSDAGLDLVGYGVDDYGWAVGRVRAAAAAATAESSVSTVSEASASAPVSNEGGPR